MKKTAEIIIADRKAVGYFCLLNPIQAKKVLFVMSLLKGDQRLGDSSVPEARHIAQFYEGVINASFAKELAVNLAVEYSKVHPGVLLTKKQYEQYTHVAYRKLYEALGLTGFDYVVSVVRQSKATIQKPGSKTDEKGMLMALRWVERSDTVDKESSNYRHRSKGLELMGLGELKKELIPYSFVVANVYDEVTPGTQPIFEEPYDEEEAEEETKPLTAIEMVAHFVENSHLLKDFYGTSKPTAPEGFPEEELREGSTVYALAKKGMFNDSNVVLEYVDSMKKFEFCAKRIAEVFADEEIQVITEKAETVQEILRLVASL